MKAGILAIAACVAFSPQALAGETPWGELKKLFHEPVTELKQQFRQLRDSANEKTPPRADEAKATKPAEDVVKRDDKPTPEPKAKTAAVADVPIPRPRPDVTFSYAADETPVPPAKPAYAAIGALTPPGRSLIAPPPAAGATCGVALASLGVEASTMAPVHEGGCGIARPVAVASLAGVDLSTKAIVECELAETFANWVRDEVQPEARKILGGEVVGLRIAASYHCRPRNGVKGAKLSEHGKGNAIDIAAFKVERHGWIEVGGGHVGKEARFLKAVRTAACNPFTTVLGPGSDAYHSDHFHLDLAQRRKSGPSKGLYCK